MENKKLKLIYKKHKKRYSFKASLFEDRLYFEFFKLDSKDAVKLDSDYVCVISNKLNNNHIRVYIKKQDFTKDIEKNVYQIIKKVKHEIIFMILNEDFYSFTLV